MADVQTQETVTQKPASDEYINKMYDANLGSQKQTLEMNYNQNVANLDRAQKNARAQTDTNLNRTYVEAAKAAKNYGEVQNAYGLTSGAMAQARLARDNQLNADMTALRGVQMNADAEIDRNRALLAQQYQSEIAKAQADNDMARAEALYKDASTKEERLLQQQEAIAKIFADKQGDYSYYQKLYGLTEEQMAQLMGSSGGGWEEKKTYGSKKDGSSADGGLSKPYSTYVNPKYVEFSAKATKTNNGLM